MRAERGGEEEACARGCQRSVQKAGPRTASWKDSDELRDRRCHSESAVRFGRRRISEVEVSGMMPMLNSELLASVTPYARPGKDRTSSSGGDSHFK